MKLRMVGCCVVLCGWVLSVWACQGASVTPISLRVHYRPMAPTFQSATGWKVTLEAASLRFQALRFYQGNPAYTWRKMPRQGLNMLAESLLPTAWAHPGHFEGGAIKAELIMAQALDLLGDKDREVAQVNGFTGDYGAAEFSFAAEDRVSLRGDATKDGQTLKFVCDLALEKRDISGIAFTHTVTSNAKPFVFEVHTQKWFDLTDFARFVQDETLSERKRPDQAEANILRKAVLQSTSYAVLYP